MGFSHLVSKVLGAQSMCSCAQSMCSSRMDQECSLLPFLADCLACSLFDLCLQPLTPLYETPPLILISPIRWLSNGKG